MLIDTHCHLDFPDFDTDRDEVIRRAQASGVERIINIGSSLKSSKSSVALAGQYECVYATVGIHPHEADSVDDKMISDLKALADNQKVVAIGEIGLDYYRNFSRPDRQKNLFSSLIGFAKDKALPVVVHSRQAQEETLGILKKNMPLKALIHCFSSDAAFLKACLDLGFYVSFTCNITYKKAANLKELIKCIPLERLLLETDAPFLPPQGLRGKRNEPAQVRLLAEEVSRIRGVEFGEITQATTANAKSFFNLK